LRLIRLYSYRGFYEQVRLKVVCRDPRKIPSERLFELEKKLYLINISVEGLELDEQGKNQDEDDGKGDDEEDNSDDNYDDLDEEQDHID
jgi:hypothetical protein